MIIHLLNEILYELNMFNPISAGVLENEDMLGGGQFEPPSPLNPMFDVQI